MAPDIVAPLAGLIDRLIADPGQRDAAKLALLRLEESGDLAPLRTALRAALIDPAPADPWTARARPTFLYVMYALLLGAIPMGIVAALRPAMATHIAAGVSAYLAAIPEPLYALFGAGYIGYTAARSWGKAKGVER